MSLAPRSGRVPPLQRAEQAQLQEALEASQAAMAGSANPDQQRAPLPPLPPLTASVPFQTLHGTLDNTISTDSASTSLQITSSSSDRVATSSLNSLLPPLPRFPARSTDHSSISDPDTSDSLQRPGSTERPDGIVATLNTLANLSTERSGAASSEIETSTTAGPDPVAEIDEQDVVPDSDNEGSGPGDPPPPASFELGQPRRHAAVASKNPVVPGIGRLPTLPNEKNPKASPPVLDATSTATPSSASSLSKKQRAYVEVQKPAGERTKSTAKVSRRKGSSLSTTTVASDDDKDGYEDSELDATGARTSRRTSVSKKQGGRRRIAIGSSDDDEDEEVREAAQDSGEKNKTTTKKGPATGKKDDQSSPLTDYDEPVFTKSKPSKSRTSSVVSSTSKSKSMRVAPPSSPDPLAAPLDLLDTTDPDLSTAAGFPSKPKTSTSSAPRLDSIHESSAPKGGVALIPRGSDDFAKAAAEIERRQEEDDDEFGVVKKVARKKSVTAGRKRSIGAAAAEVVKTKSRSVSKDKSAVVIKKRAGSTRGAPEENGLADGREGSIASELANGGEFGRDESTIDLQPEIKANAKGKGKAKAREPAKGRRSKAVVASDSHEENDEVANDHLEEEEEEGDAEGSRRSPRVNKGRAKKRLGEDDDDPSEETGPSTKKTKHTTSNGKGKKRATESFDVEAEDGGEGVPVVEAIDVTKDAKGIPQQPNPSASSTASASARNRSNRSVAASVSPANSRGSRSASVKDPVSSVGSRSRSMSKEERAADASKRMNLVMEAAAVPDPKAFEFMAQEEKNKKVTSKTKRKAIDTDSDADDESEGHSEAEESDAGDDTKGNSKGKGKGEVASPSVSKKGQAAKENEDLPTPKPKAVAALARGRDRSSSPFSKTPKPGSLADIIAKRNIGSYLSPGLSSRSKVPSLHRNLKPPTTVQKVIAVKRPIKKKKKGEWSCSDEEKPWYQQKDPEEWDSDDQARWNRRQKRIERGLPADTDNDSD